MPAGGRRITQPAARGLATVRTNRTMVALGAARRRSRRHHCRHRAPLPTPHPQIHSRIIIDRLPLHGIEQLCELNMATNAGEVNRQERTHVSAETPSRFEGCSVSETMRTLRILNSSEQEKDVNQGRRACFFRLEKLDSVSVGFFPVTSAPDGGAEFREQRIPRAEAARGGSNTLTLGWAAPTAARPTGSAAIRRLVIPTIGRIDIAALILDLLVNSSY